MMKVCRNCRTENPLDEVLCIDCGISLTRAATGEEAMKLKNHNEGIALHDRGEYEKAIAHFTEAIRLDPNYADAYNRRGLAHYDLGECEEAIADFAEALRLDPDQADAYYNYYNRGLAHHELCSYGEAIADCTEAIRIDPSLSMAHSLRGAAHLELGEYERASEDCGEAIRLDPSDADAYCNRGLAYTALGAHYDAIADYNEAIRNDPSLSMAYSNRGAAHLELGEYSEASADFAEAVRLDPKRADAYNNRGIAHHALGEYAEAIDSFTEAIRLKPNLAASYSHRAAAYLQQGEYEQAIDDCSEAIRLEPDSAEDWHHRGIAQYQLGEYHKAIDDYAMVIQIDPDDAEAYHERGLAHSALGKHEEAIADFTESIRQHPHHALAYYNRGLSHSALREREEAIEDYTTAVRIDPGFATGLADMVLTSPDLPSAFKEEVKAASRRKKWRSRKGPQLPLTASGLVYLFGEEFANPGEGLLSGSQTRLVRSGQKVGSVSLALKLFEAALVSLAEEGYITLRMEQRKDRLGVTRKVVTVTEKKSGDDLPRSLEKEIMGVVRDDPKENAVKTVVERVIPQGTSADRVKWTVSYVIEVLSEAGCLDWVLEPGSLFAYEVHRWADQEAVVSLAGEVETLKKTLRAFESVNGLFHRSLVKEVRAGLGRDTAWLEVLLEWL